MSCVIRWSLNLHFTNVLTNPPAPFMGFAYDWLRSHVNQSGSVFVTSPESVAANQIQTSDHIHDFTIQCTQGHFLCTMHFVNHIPNTKHYYNRFHVKPLRGHLVRLQNKMHVFSVVCYDELSSVPTRVHNNTAYNLLWLLQWEFKDAEDRNEDGWRERKQMKIYPVIIFKAGRRSFSKHGKCFYEPQPSRHLLQHLRNHFPLNLDLFISGKVMWLTGSVFSPGVHPSAESAAFSRRAVAVGDILMVKKMVEIFNTIMATATVRATIIAAAAAAAASSSDTNTTSARTRLHQVKSVQQTVRVVCRCSIVFGCFGVLHSLHTVMGARQEATLERRKTTLTVCLRRWTTTKTYNCVKAVIRRRIVTDEMENVVFPF